MSIPGVRALLAIPIALALACGTGGEESADRAPATDRELDLALSSDNAPATFEDKPSLSPDVDAGSSPSVTFAGDASKVRPAPAAGRPAIGTVSSVSVRIPVASVRTVPIGTMLPLALNETLSTHSNEPGDAFTATLTEAVTDRDGATLIPAGAILRGRVTQVQKSGRVGETAVLSLAFEAIRFDGRSYPLEATVVAANPERVSRESTGDQVGKVAVGAAAGAVLGRVIGGNTRSTIRGAVIGAAAGTAIALGTADVDAVLMQGSIMMIRTDAPVAVVVMRP
jgi:hypothetical protein